MTTPKPKTPQPTDPTEPTEPTGRDWLAEQCESPDPYIANAAKRLEKRLDDADARAAQIAAAAAAAAGLKASDYLHVFRVDGEWMWSADTPVGSYVSEALGMPSKRTEQAAKEQGLKWLSDKFKRVAAG